MIACEIRPASNARFMYIRRIRFWWVWKPNAADLLDVLLVLYAQIICLVTLSSHKSKNMENLKKMILVPVMLLQDRSS